MNERCIKMANNTTVKKTPFSTTADNIISNAIKGAIRLFWVGILAFALVFSSLAFYYTYSYTPMYTASATFVINVSGEYNTETRYYDVETANQLAKTFPSVLKSGVLSDIVANDLGLKSIPCSITASAVESTNLFTVSVTGSDPQLAYDVLESIIRNYPKIANFVVGNTKLAPIDASGVPTDPINYISYFGALKIGLIAGIAAYILAIFAYVLTRSTITTVDDINAVTNVKCLGTVPKVAAKRRNNNRKKALLITSRHVSHSFLEGIRLVRTRIEKECSDRGAKVLLVTSALAGEGKTTLACNLALSLARRENRVFLIDCDLRHPSVASCLNFKNLKYGIGDYLTGKAELNQIAYNASNPSGLVVIPATGYCKNALQLISSDEMKELIEKLRDKADYIILDSSPCMLMSDAAVISSSADATVMVIRQDYASKDKIIEGIESLTESGTPVVGCILNNAEYGIIGYGYGGYYYGRYSYNRYGYSRYYGDSQPTEPKTE